jgi:rubrerythrin
VKSIIWVCDKCGEWLQFRNQDDKECPYCGGGSFHEKTEDDE